LYREGGITHSIFSTLDPIFIPKGLNMNCTAFFAVRLEEMDVGQPQRG
jgi:hypothetical protein